MTSLCFLMRIIYSCMKVMQLWQMFVCILHHTGRIVHLPLLRHRKTGRCSSQTSNITWRIYRRKNEFTQKQPMEISADCPFAQLLNLRGNSLLIVCYFSLLLGESMAKQKPRFYPVEVRTEMKTPLLQVYLRALALSTCIILLANTFHL